MTKRKPRTSGVDALLSKDQSKPERNQKRLDKDNESVWLFIPEGLLDLLRSQPKPLPTGTIRGILQFVDGLHRATKARGESDTRFHWVLLRKNIINWSRGVGAWLINSGIVVQTGDYVVGKKSNSYSFSKEWGSKKVKLTKFHDRKMCGKLFQQKNRPPEGLPFHVQRLRSCLRMVSTDETSLELDERKVVDERQENPWGPDWQPASRLSERQGNLRGG